MPAMPAMAPVAPMTVPVAVVRLLMLMCVRHGVQIHSRQDQLGPGRDLVLL